MRLVNADLLSMVVNEYLNEHRVKPRHDDEDWKRYWDYEFEIFNAVLDAIREEAPAETIIIESEHSDWVPCSQELPPVGADVILTFRDTFHTHPDWPKVAVKPAWRCNVEEETPDGRWAIEGRLGNFGVNIEDGIAWMPMPKMYEEQDNGGGMEMSLTDLYVRDKQTGEIRRIGDDRHDQLTINDKGQLCYYNQQNGDGCRTGDNCGGYEFVPNQDEYGYNADPRKGEQE